MDEFIFVDDRAGLPARLVKAAFGYYRANNSVSIELLCAEDDRDCMAGEPYAPATVCIAAVPPPPEGFVVIRNWSEYEGIADLLLKAGVIEGGPVEYRRSGFVSAPIYKLSAGALELLSAR